MSTSSSISKALLGGDEVFSEQTHVFYFHDKVKALLSYFTFSEYLHIFNTLEGQLDLEYRGVRLCNYAKHLVTCVFASFRGYPKLIEVFAEKYKERWPKKFTINNNLVVLVVTKYVLNGRIATNVMPNSIS